MKALLQRLSILHALLLVAAISLTPAQADAFCGFYVSGASADLYNSATQVVMMRQGKITALSMRNNYQGPPEDFALVIPVPEVLQESSVKTLDDAIFEKVDRLAAPRLVEYWQSAHCPSLGPLRKSVKGRTSDIDSLSDVLESKNGAAVVAVEAKFKVGEYEVVVLSAAESNGLEKWLLANKYNIPKGASAALAPYIAQGMYFFVAKVDASKVKFDAKGNALLSPLRFHYHSQEFSLPVRLGLLNAKGPQDLIVHTLSREGRMQVANRENITIPTNLVVPAKIKKSFAAFYEALFSYALEQKPGAVVTEYAWAAWKCDPCPVTALQTNDLLALGADVIDGSVGGKIPQALIREVSTSERGVSSELAALRRQLMNDTSPFTRCYKPMLEDKDVRQGEVLMRFDFKETGELKRAKVIGSTMGNRRLSKCLKSELRGFKSNASFDKPTSFKVRVGFSYTIPRRRRTGAAGWTLTRLHARYDAKSLTDDLIFEKAPDILGGTGMPTGADGTIEHTGAHPTRHRSNFQGRYIILHHDKSKLSCKKSERRYYWGGPKRGAGAAKPISAYGMDTHAKKSTHKLSKQHKRSVREQLEPQKDDDS